MDMAGCSPADNRFVRLLFIVLHHTETQKISFLPLKMSRQSQRPHTKPIRPFLWFAATLDGFKKLNDHRENALACRYKFATLDT